MLISSISFWSTLPTAQNKASVSIISLNITGNSETGGFTGYSYNSKFRNIAISGTLTGESKTGGFIGILEHCDVSMCNTSLDIYCENNAGGFISEISFASVDSSYADCNIEGNNYISGFINHVYTPMGSVSSITKCFSSGTIKGSYKIGGFIGDDESNTTISNCYTSVEIVSDRDYIGGFICSVGMNSEISNCYSSGSIAASGSYNTIAGFATNNDWWGEIINCYWDTDKYDFTYSGGGEGRTTEELLGYGDSVYVDWDFVNTWENNHNSEPPNYPTFKWRNTTSIEDDDSVVPESVILIQNYPNPFNPCTKIWYILNKSSNINLSVFNSKGELVRTLVDGNKNKGSHSVNFDASNLNSGLYFYKLTTDETSVTRKMLLLKWDVPMLEFLDKTNLIDLSSCVPEKNYYSPQHWQND